MRTTTAPMSAAVSNNTSIEAYWQEVAPHLERFDPQEALVQWGRVAPDFRHAIQCRVEDWLVAKLALPSTEKHPWRDEQGLQRMIYQIWPEIPCRCFEMSMLPSIMARMAARGL